MQIKTTRYKFSPGKATKVKSPRIQVLGTRWGPGNSQTPWMGIETGSAGRQGRSQVRTGAAAAEVVNGAFQGPHHGPALYPTAAPARPLIPPSIHPTRLPDGAQPSLKGTRGQECRHTWSLGQQATAVVSSPVQPGHGFQGLHWVCGCGEGAGGVQNLEEQKQDRPRDPG